LSEGGIPERRPDCLASNPFSISDVLEGASSLNKPKLFLLGFAVPSLAHAQALCSQSATAAQHCLTPKNQLGASNRSQIYFPFFRSAAWMLSEGI
jgi:hypothetical protein